MEIKLFGVIEYNDGSLLTLISSVEWGNQHDFILLHNWSWNDRTYDLSEFVIISAVTLVVPVTIIISVIMGFQKENHFISLSLIFQIDYHSNYYD